MEYNNHNLRKIQILNILSYYSETPHTAKFIHDLISKISLNSLCNSLKRYFVQGLLKRKRVNNKFYYEITQKGIERLEYLIGKQTIKEKAELLAREPIKDLLFIREKIKLNA